MAESTLTVYFDDPFWVGLVELRDDDRLLAVRHIFGAEPAPGEVFHFVLHELPGLLRHVASRPAEAPAPPRPRSPKRLARAAARAVSSHGGSTWAQEVLRLQIEQRKLDRRRGH